MTSELLKKLFWYGCLAGILVFTGWGLTVLTDRIDYKWYWNRVPHHFFFSGAVDHYAAADGVADVEEIDDETSKVIINYDDGSQETFEVNTDSLQVYPEARVDDNTKLGESTILQTGILVKGLLLTLKFSVYSTILGMIIGLFAGLGRISSNPLFKGLSTIYVELIRGTPLLVQVFIMYYFAATVLGFGRTWSGIIALSVFAGAYVAEIVRAGIQSIDPGQMEAARSLGMNLFQSMGYIILPQAFRRILPPLAGQFISLIKDSSLLSVIAITELTKAGREIITSTFAVFEIWFTVGAMYLLLTFPLSMFVRYIERRFAVSD